LSNDSVEYGLGYSSGSKVSFDASIFSGAVYNFNQLNLFIHVYDNEGAFIVYDLPESITVYPNEDNFTVTIDRLITKDSKFETNVILSEGSFVSSVQEIQRISSILNAQSLSDKLGLILAGSGQNFPKISGPLSNYSGVKPVNLILFILV
jgi:hypothetical protein